MAEDSDIPPFCKTLSDTQKAWLAEIRTQQRTKANGHIRHYPIPSWHPECEEGDPVIATEFDFGLCPEATVAVCEYLYFDELGRLRLDVKKLAIAVVQVQVEVDNGTA